MDTVNNLATACQDGGSLCPEPHSDEISYANALPFLVNPIKVTALVVIPFSSGVFISSTLLSKLLPKSSILFT